jgi:NADPH-dependent curcumin reductase CurA
MRTWINGMTSYVEPVKPGMVMKARTIGEVIFTKSDKFQIGDLVMGEGGW